MSNTKLPTQFQFLPNTELVILPQADVEQYPSEQLGYYRYFAQAPSVQPRKQYFIMKVNGALASPREHKEIDILVSLGEFLERKLKKVKHRVVDIQLPVAHGYSGNAYSFRAVKDLFENAGIARNS